MSEQIAPARFLCMAEKDSLSEIGEIPHTKADTLQNLCFVVAALNEAIGPWDIHGVQDFLEPVVICFDAVVEFRQIHDFNGCDPVNKFWLSSFRRIGMYYFQPLWLPSFAGYHQNHAEAVRAGKLRCEHYCRLGVSTEWTVVTLAAGFPMVSG